MKQKLIFGAGINDADYKVEPRVNGKRTWCPFYVKWKSMIQRAYSIKFQNKNPTYKGTSIAEEWLIFSNFKEWMQAQDWDEKEIDKDILFPGNKMYSPETCCFVSKELNRVLNCYEKGRGIYPRGVSYHKGNRRLSAEIKIHGKAKSLGYHDTVTSASNAYIRAKIEHIKSFYPLVSRDIREGLDKHIAILKDDLNKDWVKCDKEETVEGFADKVGYRDQPRIKELA